MKHETRVDSRTIQTKETIQRALREMILEMDYPKITVSELTRRAGLHRKTFYLHYETIEALFDELAESIVKQVKDMVDRTVEESERIDINKLLQGLGDLLTGSEPELHRRLFCNSSYYFVYNKIQESSTAYLYEKIRSRSSADPEALECFVYFVSYGCNAIWRSYYSKGRPNAPEMMPASIKALTEMAWGLIQAPAGR